LAKNARIRDEYSRISSNVEQIASQREFFYRIWQKYFKY